MRLGKIEKHILVWAHRQRDARGVVKRYSFYLGKSGALLSYARIFYGKRTIPKHTANIKSWVSGRAYSALHSSFTRALKRLTDKGLIVYEPDGTRLRMLRHTFVDNLKKPGERGYRRSMFMLTPQGETIARKLWRSQKRLI